MALNNNDAAARPESIHTQPGLTSEIDLYAELVAFAKLSPDEQSRLGNRSGQSSEPERTASCAATETIEPKSNPAEIEETADDLVAKGNPPEVVGVNSPTEPVDLVRDVSAKEPASESQLSIGDGDRSSRPSGQQSRFELPQEIVYTGAMSRGVCLACGAESDADDLFCMTCAGFVDEVASTVPSPPLCKGCKHKIDPDEIFCPWCGSSAPV
jgi:hypothetical protein